LYSNTKSNEELLQISKQYLQKLFIRFCIMRKLVLNATILTAANSVYLNLRISQQGADGSEFRTEGTGIERPFKGQRVV
jgi:hypothetical protein